MLAKSRLPGDPKLRAIFANRMDHHARVRINRSSMLPEATVALYPRLSFWGQYTDAAGQTSWVSPSVSFSMGKTANYFVACVNESLERQLLPFSLSHVAGLHPACSELANSMDICRLFVLECKLSTSSKCADLLDGPTLNWWAGDDGNLNLDNSIMDKCMKRTIAGCQEKNIYPGGCNFVGDRTAATLAMAMFRDEVEVHTEVQAQDIILFNAFLMYNQFDENGVIVQPQIEALLTIWNATLALAKTSKSRSPYLIYRETHAQAFGDGTHGLFLKPAPCGTLNLSAATGSTGNWRNELLAPILERFGYPVLKIHTLSATLHSFQTHGLFPGLKSKHTGGMDCTHQCMPSDDIDTWNLLLLEFLETHSEFLSSHEISNKPFRGNISQGDELRRDTRST